MTQRNLVTLQGGTPYKHQIAELLPFTNYTILVYAFNTANETFQSVDATTKPAGIVMLLQLSYEALCSNASSWSLALVFEVLLKKLRSVKVIGGDEYEVQRLLATLTVPPMFTSITIALKSVVANS